MSKKKPQQPSKEELLRQLPAELDWDNPKLPVTFHKLVRALAHMKKFDEIQKIADVSEALAAAAYIANNTSVAKVWEDIQCVAIRHVGELLELRKAQGHRSDLARKEEGQWRYRCNECDTLADCEFWHCERCNAHWPMEYEWCYLCEEATAPSEPTTSLEFIELPDAPFRKSIGAHAAGREAGLAERQIKTAVRVARVPLGRFNEVLGSDERDRVKILDAEGTRHRETLVQTSKDLYEASEKRATEALYKGLFALSHEHLDCADIAEVIKRIAEERNPDGMKEHRYKRLAACLLDGASGIAQMEFPSRDN